MNSKLKYNNLEVYYSSFYIKRKRAFLLLSRKWKEFTKWTHKKLNEEAYKDE